MPLWIAFLLAIGVAPAPDTDATRHPARSFAPAIGAEQGGQPPRDSAATHARAVLAISEFFLEWQRLWRGSSTMRVALMRGMEARQDRSAYLHCHPDAPSRVRPGSPNSAGDQYTRKFEQYSLLQGEHTMFAVCPSWILSKSVPEAHDERVSHDGALLPEVRPRARAARDRVLLVLTSAAAAYPGSGFLAGQLVRFHVDQGDTIGATRAAERCRAERWWCLALTGYVQTRIGSVLEAEATYRAMEAVQSPEQRCAWQDARDLLDPAEMSAYDKVRCTERAASIATMWWLSDPLYRVRGNERWVAHQSRRVDVALHSALDNDERYVWDVARGGDALARLITRYDWASFAWWDGVGTDDNHSGYLFQHRVRRSTPVPPYTTFEYSKDRVHLLPTWNAALRPFSATPADWSLAWEDEYGEIDGGWWSTEHFQIPGRLLQLPEGQTALFRRQSQISVATAHNLRQPLTHTYSLRFDVMLLSTTSADDIDTLQQRVIGGGQTTVLRSLIADSPTLLAVEALGSGGAKVSQRTRYGVQPPPTLSAMKPGEVAISDPALLSAESGAGDQRTPEESLLDHLLGSLYLDKAHRRFGVYWETYGIAAQDTVTISVTMTGDANIGGLRRLGMALNVASDPNRSISIKWTEPSPQHYTRTLAGPVPVQLRSIMLNAEQLAPGPYILSISVERPGQPVTSSRRRVVIQP